MKSADHYILKCDTPITFYPRRNKIVIGNDDFRLEPLQTHLLLYFIDHRSQVVNTQQIAAHVWQRSHVSDNLVRQVISTLRSQLQDKSRPYKFIQTIPKQGYLFEAEVEEVCEADNLVSDDTLTPNEQVQTPSCVPKARGVNTVKPVSVAIFLLIIAVGLFVTADYLINCPEDSVVTQESIIPVYIHNIEPDSTQDEVAAKNVYNAIFYGINSAKRLTGYQYSYLSSATKKVLPEYGFELRGTIKRAGAAYALNVIVKNKKTLQSMTISQTFDHDSFFSSMGDVVQKINAIIAPASSDNETANYQVASVKRYEDWHMISEGISLFYHGEGGKAFYDVAVQLQNMKAQGRENYLVNALLSYSASLKYLQSGGEDNRKQSLQLALRGFEMSPRCDIANLALGLALILNQRADEAYPYLAYATENATSPIGFFLLSVADNQSGNPNDAMHNYKRFMEIQKESNGQLYGLINDSQNITLRSLSAP